ncbi:MAG TPA: sigma factor, partial [Solirubrobacteraceae bacterium]
MAPSIAELVPAAAETLTVERPLQARRIRRGRSERALIRGAQGGSESDLEELFHRHWPRAYRAAFLIVHDHAAAEDIAQEAFMSAIRTLHR